MIVGRERHDHDYCYYAIAAALVVDVACYISAADAAGEQRRHRLKLLPKAGESHRVQHRARTEVVSARLQRLSSWRPQDRRA